MYNLTVRCLVFLPLMLCQQEPIKLLPRNPFHLINSPFSSYISSCSPGPFLLLSQSSFYLSLVLSLFTSPHFPYLFVSFSIALKLLNKAKCFVSLLGNDLHPHSLFFNGVLMNCNTVFNFNFTKDSNCRP